MDVIAYVGVLQAWLMGNIIIAGSRAWRWKPGIKSSLSAQIECGCSKRVLQKEKAREVCQNVRLFFSVTSLKPSAL